MPSPDLFAQGLKTPHGLAFDIDEELFVAEAAPGTIKKVSPQGKVAQFSGVNGRPVGLALTIRTICLSPIASDTNCCCFPSTKP